MINVRILENIKEKCPEFVGAAIFAQVINSDHNEGLWTMIDEEIVRYKATHEMDDVKKNPAISATRQAYKQLGKDPNRYRPSAEALCRRIVRGLPLYQIDTLVDIINLVSIRTGYSIGGFDADKIKGATLTLGVGMPDEPYEGIGRGVLNIEGLPVYRDAEGGIGTPTSDHERTKIDIDTTHLVVLINGYDGDEANVCSNAEYIQNLLKKYCKSDGGYYFLYK